MTSYSELAKRLQAADDSWYIVGPQAPSRVTEAESHLGITLPTSFRQYLLEVGRMSFLDHYYEGVDDDYLNPDCGFGSFTTHLRDDNELPDGLFVLEADHDADVVRCLNLNELRDGECPLVWFHVFRNEVVGDAENSFETFFLELVDAWTKT